LLMSMRIGSKNIDRRCGLSLPHNAPGLDKRFLRNSVGMALY
jgi:hypothetical protein